VIPPVSAGTIAISTGAPGDVSNAAELGAGWPNANPATASDAAQTDIFFIVTGAPFTTS
jgi:hypothetical protein